MATLRESTDNSSRSVRREAQVESKSKGEVKRSLLHLPDDEINAILDRTLITMSPEAYDKFLEMLEAPPRPDVVADVRARFARARRRCGMFDESD